MENNIITKDNSVSTQSGIENLISCLKEVIILMERISERYNLDLITGEEAFKLLLEEITQRNVSLESIANLPFTIRVNPTIMKMLETKNPNEIKIIGDNNGIIAKDYKKIINRKDTT